MAVCLWLLALATSARGDSVGTMAEAMAGDLATGCPGDVKYGNHGWKSCSDCCAADYSSATVCSAYCGVDCSQTKGCIKGADGTEQFPVIHGHHNHSHRNHSHHNKSHHNHSLHNHSRRHSHHTTPQPQASQPQPARISSVITNRRRRTAQCGKEGDNCDRCAGCAGCCSGLQCAFDRRCIGIITNHTTAAPQAIFI